MKSFLLLACLFSLCVIAYSVRIDVIRATRVKYTAASGELCFDGYKDSCEVKYCQTKCTTYACQKSNCFLDCIPGQTKIGKKCMTTLFKLYRVQGTNSIIMQGSVSRCFKQTLHYIFKLQCFNDPTCFAPIDYDTKTSPQVNHCHRTDVS